MYFDTHLDSPELISLLCNPPLRVTHHGREEAEEEEVGHHTEAAENHKHNGVIVDGLVHRHIDQTHSQLKQAEECDGVRAHLWYRQMILSHVYSPLS